MATTSFVVEFPKELLQPKSRPLAVCWNIAQPGGQTNRFQLPGEQKSFVFVLQMGYFDAIMLGVYKNTVYLLEFDTLVTLTKWMTKILFWYTSHVNTIIIILFIKTKTKTNLKKIEISYCCLQNWHLWNTKLFGDNYFQIILL